MARRTSNTERVMRDRGVYDIAEFDAWMSKRRWSWQGLDRGDYGLSVNEAMILFTFEDPVRWCETYLREGDGEPFKFFEYQKPSIRAWRQDVVHQDGAEVGKSREIMALLLWGHCTAFGGEVGNPSSLVGAPQSVFTLEIIEAIERQMGTHKALKSKSPLASFWLEPRRTPHTQLRFRCLNPRNPESPMLSTIDFRPAGHDGEAFRGVHVNALAIVDEAAKMKSKLQWTEFYRAMMPGCRFRPYSVPDGDRNTEFYRICQEAVLDLPEGAPGFRKFQWPKTIMPPPFWDAERDRIFVKLYKGRDTPGYQRNVLGLWGDAEDPVFSWGQVLPNVVDLPDYRRVQLVADTQNDVLTIEASRIELVMTRGEEAEGSGSKPTAARKSGREHLLRDDAMDLEPLIGKDDEVRRGEWAQLLSPFTAHIKPVGRYVAGGDLGERNDPTEIIVSEHIGDELVDILRVKARGLPYHAQEELIFQIDRAFGHRPDWGIDLGSAGTAVVKNLHNLDRYDGHGFEDRLVGFHFQESFECTDEEGESLTKVDSDGNTVILTAPAKHWATQCIVARLQRRGYRIPYDGDVLNDYTSHTARPGTKWPIYGKTNDHTIDARRQQMLRILRAAEADAVDIFSASAHRRTA